MHSKRCLAERTSLETRRRDKRHPVLERVWPYRPCLSPALELQSPQGPCQFLPPITISPPDEQFQMMSLKGVQVFNKQVNLSLKKKKVFLWFIFALSARKFACAPLGGKLEPMERGSEVQTRASPIKKEKLYWKIQPCVTPCSPLNWVLKLGR